MHSAAKHKRNHLDIEPSRLPDPEGTFFSCVGWPGCYQTWYKWIIHISSRKRFRRRSMPVTKVLWFLDALAKNVRKGRSLVKEDTVGFAAKHRVWRETHAVKDESSICRVAKSGASDIEIFNGPIQTRRFNSRARWYPFTVDWRCVQLR